MHCLKGVVCAGHGVASGKAKDPRFPAGTIQLQAPHFKKLGLDLAGYYMGTLNVDVAPNQFELGQADHTFEQVKWLETFPAETFSFFACQLKFNGQLHKAFIYLPHPETKVDHFQPSSLLEILAPKIEMISYGDEVELYVAPQRIALK